MTYPARMPTADIRCSHTETARCQLVVGHPDHIGHHALTATGYVAWEEQVVTAPLPWAPTFPRAED